MRLIAELHQSVWLVSYEQDLLDVPEGPEEISEDDHVDGRVLQVLDVEDP